MITPPGGSWSRYLGFALLRIVILIYIGYGFLLWWKQGSFIYHPDNQIFGACEELAHTEHLNLDGTRAYYYHNASTSRIAVVYHGNEGSACDRAIYTTAFSMHQYSYMFVEYAGYSNDPREPSKELLLQDAEHVIDFLNEQSYETVVVIGESLGSGVGSYHASKHEIDTIIYVTPFDTLASRASNLMWMYPVSLLLHQNYDNITWAHDVPRACIIHGTNDKVIPLEHAQRLYDSLATNDKTLTIIEGAGHGDIYGYTEFYTTMHQCLDASSFVSASTSDASL